MKRGSKDWVFHKFLYGKLPIDKPFFDKVNKVSKNGINKLKFLFFN